MARWYRGSQLAVASESRAAQVRSGTLADGDGPSPVWATCRQRPGPVDQGRYPGQARPERRHCLRQAFAGRDAGGLLPLQP